MVTLPFMLRELNVVEQWHRAVLEVLSGIPAIEVTIETGTCQITVEDGITVTAPRKTSRDTNSHKTSNYEPGSRPQFESPRKLVTAGPATLPGRVRSSC